MKWVKRLALVVVVALVLVALAATYVLRASLPDLDGAITFAGLTSPVVIERDALGVATITAESRIDSSRALGFVHAQERFFQMDLMRRRASGELAALLGPGAIRFDRTHRLHRMRARARRAVGVANESERALLNAYVDGVNAGLAELGARPFEYLLLRQEPAPWTVEDCLLVVASMFFELNDADGQYESTLGLMHDVLAPDLATFLSPMGTEWDAPVVGERLVTPPIPAAAIPAGPGPSSGRRFDAVTLGSNNWAVAGSRTIHGGALLASDMHLRHGVPNIWYRAVLRSGDDAAVGVTLPGTPFLVAGSNTHVAWGFTNSNGDWVDLVELEMHPDEAETYRTPDGWARFELHQETLAIAGGGTESLTVRDTIWGPVLDEDHRGTMRAIRWIAHVPGGINITIGELATATTLDEAMAIAKRSGIPPQNFVCADDAGAIGWTIAGRIPRRFGFDGRLPSSWADGTRGWNGWLAPGEYPEIREPENGLIWTANARVVGGESLAKIGDGGYDIGTRASHIRDALRALERASERDMLDLQLDDRAIFMSTWRDYFLATLDDTPIRETIETEWHGRASTESVGYRVVRELRVAVHDAVLSALTREASAADERFSIWAQRQWEGPVWKLVTEKPPHLLPPAYESWDAWINEVVDETVAGWDDPIASRTWGRARVSEIRHPLSGAMPMLSGWLDLPPRELPGDSHVPRVQSPTHGASERMVVSPGREHRGLFHMPGGQSGHPLSPYYGAGHEDWEEGRATPLMPGPTEHTLHLRPAAKAVTR